MSLTTKFQFWQEFQLKEICEQITDGKHGDCTNELGSGFYFLSAKDVINNKLSYEGARQITELDYLETQKRTRFEPLDILFTNSGTIGRMAIAKDEYRTHRTTFQKSVAILKPKQSVVQPYYLYYLLLGENRRLADFASGTAQKNLLLKDLRDFRLILPPIATQHKITSILSGYDDLIENNLRRIKILEEMAQNLYTEWFVKFHFPGHEKVKFVDSSLGRIPEGWEIARVKDIVFRIPSGKQYDNNTANRDGSVPILDQGKSGIIGFHDDKPGVYASEDEPIVVFANHTCYQRIIQFPFSAIQNVLPFKPNPNKYRNIYWLHWVTKELVSLNDYKGHWPEFVSKQLLLPPRELTELFGQYLKPIVRENYKLEQENRILGQTRDFLLPRLIYGELDVSALDIKTGDDE